MSLSKFCIGFFKPASIRAVVTLQNATFKRLLHDSAFLMEEASGGAQGATLDSKEVTDRVLSVVKKFEKVVVLVCRVCFLFKTFLGGSCQSDSAIPLCERLGTR